MTEKTTMLGVLAVCVGYAIALIPGNTSPLIVSGLIEGLGLGVADSGMVLSCELMLMGLTATGVAPLLSRLDARQVCLSGAIIQLAGHGLAAIATGLEQVLLFRCLAGVGGGAVIAAVNATIAGAPNPSRLYGLSMMAPPLIGSIVAYFMAQAIVLYAHGGAYGVLALLSLCVLPVLLGFPDYRQQSVNTAVTAPSSFWPGVALLLATFIMGASMMAYFAFIERLGVRLRLPIEETGVIIAVVIIAGALGAAIAATVESRFGLLRPLLLGNVFHGIAIVLAIEVISLPAYIVGTICEGIGLVFTLTLLFAAAARLDRFGRWAAATGGAFSLSLGAGPYLGGALIEYAGFSALTVLISVSTIITLMLLYWVDRRVDLDKAS